MLPLKNKCYFSSASNFSWSSYIFNISRPNLLSNTGHNTWQKHFPIALRGCRQSPINIVSRNAKYNSDLSFLSISYTPEDEVKLKNNGHSIEWQITQPGCKRVAMSTYPSYMGNVSFNSKWVVSYLKYKLGLWLLLLVFGKCT